MHDPETEPEEKHRIDFEDDNDNKFRFGDIDWPDEVVSLTLMRSLRAWKIALMIFLFLLNSIYKSSSLLTNMAIPHLLKNHQRFGWQNSTWVFWTSRCWVGGFYSSWQWRAATPSGQFKSAPRRWFGAGGPSDNCRPRQVPPCIWHLVRRNGHFSFGIHESARDPLYGRHQSWRRDPKAPRRPLNT